MGDFCYLRFRNRCIPSISSNFVKPDSARAIISSFVCAALQVYSSSPLSVMPLI